MGGDIDTMRARREHEDIACRAMLGKNLHDVFFNARIKPAVDSQSTEHLNRQILGVDVLEMFSPERVGKLCKEYGLEQGVAMDNKSDYDFNKTSDRNKCWEAIKRGKPGLVIGLQDFNRFMYKDSRVWMLKFEELVTRPSAT